MVLWFVCVNLRNLRETLGFHLCGLFESSCVYSPADNADHAEECSKLHYIAEKDSLFNVVLWFVCVNLRDLRETLGFLCADRLSTLACILPQIAQITQRNAAGCIISQRKTDCS